MTAATRIIIADDHPLFRGALRQAVLSKLASAEISEVGSLEELGSQLALAKDTDLVMLDLTMPGVEGFSGLLFLRADHPGIPVIVVSANDDPAVIRRCVAFGASGFLPKTSDVETMGEAVEAVLAGQVWTPPGIDMSAAEDSETADMVRRLSTLTPQQVRVLMMLSGGLLNKQIAYELGVSEATVKAHVSAILTKLNVDSRTQAVIAASRIAGSAWATTGAGATA
ncbi:MAG: response regulator [Bosea sp. (in: a-proteobacteria)]